MTPSEPIIFYDLPGRDGRAWSLNSWKTRLLLNFKGIDYKTEWVEYPDIVSKFEKLFSPHAAGSGAVAPYTIPVVQIPPGGDSKEPIYLMESHNIAKHLEAMYPELSLDVNSSQIQQCIGLVRKVLVPNAPVLMPKVPRNLLNPPSQEYFQRTRAIWFGMPLDEFEKSEKGGEAAWAAATPGLGQLAALLHENEDGPFLNGQMPTFADFVIVGLLRMMDRIEHGIYERVAKFDSAYKDLYDACGKWLERDDR